MASFNWGLDSISGRFGKWKTFAGKTYELLHSQSIKQTAKPSLRTLRMEISFKQCWQLNKWLANQINYLKAIWCQCKFNKFNFISNISDDPLCSWTTFNPLAIMDIVRLVGSPWDRNESRCSGYLLDRLNFCKLKFILKSFHRVWLYNLFQFYKCKFQSFTLNFKVSINVNSFLSSIWSMRVIISLFVWFVLK